VLWVQENVPLQTLSYTPVVAGNAI
jgi:hypothetical protein